MFQTGNKKQIALKLIVLLIICLFGFSFVTATEKDEEVPYFSNKDIEAYKESSDDKIPDVRIDKLGNKEEAFREKKTQKEQEYWCRKAAQYNRKIEMERDEVKEKDKELLDLRDEWFQGSSKKRRSTEKDIKRVQKKLEGAKKKLEYAERDLSDLEDEAHRKDVPPGWLRCQFE